jgi:hypothetical protein
MNGKLTDASIYDNFSPLPPDCRGWNGNHSIFDILVREIKPKVVIEVGSWKGQSSITMGKSLKKVCDNPKLYCVDTWLGALEFWTHGCSEERNMMCRNGYPQVYYQFLSNVVHNNLQDIIFPIPATSSTGAKILKNNTIKADLIYIDASHEYEDVLNDIKIYSHLINPRGVMFGDDYGAWQGVRRAVDECFSDITVVDNIFWVKRF